MLVFFITSPGANGFDLAGTPRKFGPPLVVGMPSQLTGGPTLRSWASLCLVSLLSPSVSALIGNIATRCQSPAASSPADSPFPEPMSLGIYHADLYLSSLVAGAGKFGNTRNNKPRRTTHKEGPAYWMAVVGGFSAGTFSFMFFYYLITCVLYDNTRAFLVRKLVD